MNSLQLLCPATLGSVISIVRLVGHQVVATAIEGWVPNIKVRVDKLRSKGIIRSGAEVSTLIIQGFLLPIVLTVLVNGLFWVIRGLHGTYSPLVVSMYVLYMLLFTYGLTYYINLRLIPALVLLLIFGLAIGGLETHKYRIPGMDKLYDRTQMKAAYQFTDYNNKAKGIDPKAQPDRSVGVMGNPWGLLRLEEIAFRSKVERDKGKMGKRTPLVVIVASGGGLRSAAWTYSMLERLEEAFREPDMEPESDDGSRSVNFAKHVRMISGASGGMLGAAYYTAILPEPKVMEAQWADGTRTSDMQKKYEYMTRDCLTPIVDRMLLGDLLAMFSPFPPSNDRGVTLEKTWSTNMEDSLSIPLSYLKSKERSGWCPSLVFSPMMIEDGRRLLITNLDLDPVVRNAGNEVGGTKKGEKRTFSREAVEFYKSFPENDETHMKLSTAVRLSASFPFFSPSVTLPTWPRRRIVDAGYYDNYGVSVAASYLFSQSNRKWLTENASGILFVQIRDGISEMDRIMGDPPLDSKLPPPSQVQLTLEELTSPVEGVLNARVSTASYRNDGMLELLSNYFAEVEENVDADYFTTVTFEYPFEASLSWYLTRQERTDIRLAAGVSVPKSLNGQTSQTLRCDQTTAKDLIDAKVKAVKLWWKDRGREDAIRLEKEAKKLANAQMAK